MANPRILVIDIDPAILQVLSSYLARNSFAARLVQAGIEDVITNSQPPRADLALLSLGESGGGLAKLEQLRQVHPKLKIVVLSQNGDNPHVVKAIRLGAQDYVAWPFRDSELVDLLRRHTNSPGKADSASEHIEELAGEHFFVSASTLMNKVRVQAGLLADINVPVLILGESGTGKEVVAQLIHKLSSRTNERFLKVNCAALPSELLESELFGYERGAFTGAIRTKPGKFELCEKGTILLDEIAEIPANLQAKLLHVLQDKQFFRLGGETTIDVNVRVLAATNVDIQEAMAERRFRKDLYYRLSAFSIYLPPLRERREEIPVLLRHFMQRIAAQYSRIPLPFSSRLMNACLAYTWPGNLRELENFVKRYLVMADESMALIELGSNDRDDSHGRKRDHKLCDSGPPFSEESGSDLKCLLRNLKDDAEVEAITKALKGTNWNRRRAAELLHISYRGLLYKIHQHGITPPPSKQTDNRGFHPRPEGTFAQASGIGGPKPIR